LDLFGGAKIAPFFVAMAWPGEEVDSRPLKVESVWRSGVVDALRVLKLRSFAPVGGLRMTIALLMVEAVMEWRGGVEVRR
jgi:hypothetical protein